jgi:hypothetical protein
MLLGVFLGFVFYNDDWSNVSFYKASSKSIESAKFHRNKLKCKLVFWYIVCLGIVIIDFMFINNETSLVVMWKSIEYPL